MYVFVIIQIHYIVVDVNSRVLQKGEFNLRGRRKEQVAYEFWEKIKRNSPLNVTLEKVICEKEDITDMVKEIEKRKETDHNFPF
ncbi:hypothetical protein [Bacillus sp. FJAT-49736]|uniref:hypothetical protein n=1 Tax=Bacillus sp. FJAT-49736 TaxID=2833582 RepID=UPI001BCA23CE|nr:hypothetical protein [Bacillus sp. FJAT-49736]MBS4171954.1 hypothetical protein [Bacillus sp. FJAT-49736]